MTKIGIKLCTSTIQRQAVQKVLVQVWWPLRMIVSSSLYYKLYSSGQPNTAATLWEKTGDDWHDYHDGYL